VHLGVVDPETFDLDDDLAAVRLRFGYVRVDKAVQSAKLPEDDRTHAFATRLFTYDCRCRGQSCHRAAFQRPRDILGYLTQNIGSKTIWSTRRKDRLVPNERDQRRWIVRVPAGSLISDRR
jgi:hypothetical protein